jgi:hypothetical protein
MLKNQNLVGCTLKKIKIWPFLGNVLKISIILKIFGAHLIRKRDFEN